MQVLVVVALIVEKIWNFEVNCVKDNGAQNIGQGHRVRVPAKAGHARFDANVELQHKCWQTDGQKSGRLCRNLLQAEVWQKYIFIYW